MKRSQLIDLITTSVKANKINVDKKTARDSPVMGDKTSEDIVRMFPYVNDTLVDLMSMDYKLFIGKIEWVAPKPTTFRVTLKNGNDFYLTWNSAEFMVNINGLDFDLGSVSDELRCIKQIKDSLIYGPFNKNEDDGVENDISDTDKSSGSGGGGLDNPFDGSGGGDDFDDSDDDLFAGDDIDDPVETGEDEIGPDDGEEIDMEV